MDNKDKSELSKARLNSAHESLDAAQTLLRSANYQSAANRSYYTIFHAMRAVLALDEIDFKRHSGVIGEFRRRYIKTAIFSKEMSDIITSAFFIRTNSDYKDFYIVAKDDVTEQVANAERFLETVERYLKENIF